jgi:hypothetical protein
MSADFYADLDVDRLGRRFRCRCGRRTSSIARASDSAPARTDSADIPAGKPFAIKSDRFGGDEFRTIAASADGAVPACENGMAHRAAHG